MDADQKYQEEEMNNPFRITTIVKLCLLLVLSAMLPPVSCYATPDQEKAKETRGFNPQGQLVEEMKDGDSFIEQMYKEADKLNDYQLVYETTTFKKPNAVVESGNLYFKKPKLMRMEETGAFNKGSVAVIGKDGKARAHAGGIAGIVTLTMSPDDKMLDAANGDKMEDSDFLSLTRILKEKLKQGHSSRVSEKPVTVVGIPEPVYVLELFRPAEPKNCTKRIFVHPKSILPVRWDDYDYKDPCLSIWTNVRTNIGLSDELFKL